MYKDLHAASHRHLSLIRLFQSHTKLPLSQPHEVTFQRKEKGFISLNINLDCVQSYIDLIINLLIHV